MSEQGLLAGSVLEHVTQSRGCEFKPSVGRRVYLKKKKFEENEPLRVFDSMHCILGRFFFNKQDV